MMRLETKSLASSDTASKVSSSKYQFADRTLFRVSVSSSPRKGERPLSLEGSRVGQESEAAGWGRTQEAACAGKTPGFQSGTDLGLNLAG